MKQLTGNRGVDVVIETSGSYPGLQAGLRRLTYGGRIAIVGWFGRDRGGFDLGHEAHVNNATLIFSRACSETNPDYPPLGLGTSERNLLAFAQSGQDQLRGRAGSRRFLRGSWRRLSRIRRGKSVSECEDGREVLRRFAMSKIRVAILGMGGMA